MVHITGKMSTFNYMVLQYKTLRNVVYCHHIEITRAESYPFILVIERDYCRFHILTKSDGIQSMLVIFFCTAPNIKRYSMILLSVLALIQC